MMALYFRVVPYDDLAIVSGYAGDRVAKLRYFLVESGIYHQLLARNPGNKLYRFNEAAVQGEIANLLAALGNPQEAGRLARTAISTLNTLALQPQASSIELSVAARALLETKVRGLVDLKLALSLAKRADTPDSGDSEVKETLANAYWENGDRQSAIRAIEQALALIESQPTPTRISLEKSLAHYRTAKLPR
jgi:Flp pilus assembly protein TadD